LFLLFVVFKLHLVLQVLETTSSLDSRKSRNSKITGNLQGANLDECPPLQVPSPFQLSTYQ